MFIRLLLLLTVVPFVELVILLKLAELIHWEWTMLLILVTGVVGAWLARREGVKVLTRIQHDIEAGIPPTESMVEGFLVLAAGLVLITPGLITDLCGFALLIPPVRSWLRRRLFDYFKKRVVIMHTNMDGFSGPDFSGHDSSGDTFVDVDATGFDSQTPRNDSSTTSPTHFLED